jgi:hypothetical protein
MTAAATEAHRKRAARAGRKTVSASLPPGLARWIVHLAEHDASPEDFMAWAGALAAIATALERSFQNSGSEVRDLILRLHEQLSGRSIPPGSAPSPELAPFLPWMKTRLEETSDPVSPRIVLMQWIDTASERLTLRRYHRPDLPAHHARTLLLAPVRHLGSGILSKPANADERQLISPEQDTDERDKELALVFLRFVDLLDADRLGIQGKNRILPPDAMEFGGFYGISENVQPPDDEELKRWTRELRAKVRQLTESMGSGTPFQPLLREMESVLDTRLRTKSWPRSFLRKSVTERDRSRPFWRRWRDRK